MSVSADHILDIAKATADLDDARANTARRLLLLREAEQLVRDRRDDFERSRVVVRRMQKRHYRLITGRN